MKARIPRFRRLRGLAQVTKRIARPCIAPGMTYGLQVVGAPPATVRTMTGLVRTGWSKTPTGSSTMLASFLEAAPHLQPE
eukprot:6265616-Pyramimonas_sp.AAC.1